MTSGEIEGYQYAVIEQTGLIAIRRPDGSMCMLPGSEDPVASLRTFIEQELTPS